MIPAPKRRWFQFSLRWLALAFALLSVLLGLAIREVAIVSERNHLRQWVSEHSVSQTTAGTFNEFERRRSSIPFWRRWLGDNESARYIVVHNCSDADLQRVRSAFPEANVDRFSANGANVP